MALKKFNFRALTSLTLLWMFLALLVSGVVLYIAPPGRIAHWTDWALLGLTKEVKLLLVMILELLKLVSL